MRAPVRSGASPKVFSRFAPFACLMIALMPAPARAADDMTAAAQVLLIDVDADSVLYAKSPDAVFAPASLTKLMTAVVVSDEIRAGRLAIDDKVLISEHAWRRGGAPSRTWSMFVAVKSEVSVGDLLKGLTIQSANDAAIALAERTAGSEAAFTTLMNDRAKRLGMTRTVFKSPTGLPEPGQRTTARDMATLARTIITDYPELFPLYGEQSFKWGRIEQRNRNPLIFSVSGADGLGVAFVEGSGFSVVGSVERDGRHLVLVLAGEEKEKQREEDARKMIDWGFSAFEARQLFARGQEVAEARVFGGTRGSVPLVADRPISLLAPKGDSGPIVAKVVYDGPLHAPLARGAPAGTLKVWRGQTLTLQVPLRTAEPVGRGGLASRAYDGAAELVRSGINALIAKI